MDEKAYIDALGGLEEALEALSINYDNYYKTGESDDEVILSAVKELMDLEEAFLKAANLVKGDAVVWKKGLKMPERKRSK